MQEDEERSATATGILAIVFCYTYFYGRLEIASEKKGTGGSGGKIKISDDFCHALKSYIISGLGKI
ncbi:MAG: hypothetical protein ACLURV_14020 [Gallintestinimicrobium sp.]